MIEIGRVLFAGDDSNAETSKYGSDGCKGVSMAAEVEPAGQLSWEKGEGKGETVNCEKSS